MFQNDLAERLDAVERRLDAAYPEPTEGAVDSDTIERVEGFAERLADLEAVVEAVEGYVGEPTREALDHAVGSAVEKANERGVEVTKERILTQSGFSALPSRGFPLAPVPPWWYVTANVWHVEVHGTYASFVVRADQGGPSGGGQVSYVRDGQLVRLDVDGDGRPETLGTSDRVRFFATSTVAVSVPRGGGGVGNGETDFEAMTEGWNPDRGADNACRTPGGFGENPDFDVCRDDDRHRIGRDGQ